MPNRRVALELAWTNFRVVLGLALQARPAVGSSSHFEISAFIIIEIDLLIPHRT